MKPSLPLFIRRWQQLRRERKLTSLLQQRELIRKEGMSVYALVEDCYPTSISSNNLKLWRLRLCIRLLNHTSVHALTYAFLPQDWQSVKGISAKVQFLAGDLSQVIVKI